MIHFFDTFAGIVTTKKCYHQRGCYFEVYCNVKYVGELYGVDTECEPILLNKIERFLREKGY
jgi:hypothetical protein